MHRKQALARAESGRVVQRGRMIGVGGATDATGRPESCKDHGCIVHSKLCAPDKGSPVLIDNKTVSPWQVSVH